MHLDSCPHCQASLEPALDPSSDCPDCGQALGTAAAKGSTDSTTVGKPGAAEELDRTVVRPRKPAKPTAAPSPEAKLAGGSASTPTGRPTGKPAGQPASSTPVKPADPLLNKVLGGCKLEEMIGRGAMGSVYRATQVNLDRCVAIKTIRPEYVSDENVLKRFQQEAKTVGRFSTPHVVQIHQVGYQEGTHFIVMEFVDGGTVREFARTQPLERLSTEDAIRFLRECCLGLQEAQAAGVLHRDIKPDNLLLNRRGVLKIADFGIAKVLESDVQMTMTSELTGTPMYMSPEQCRAATLDFRTDMYSLGASFYYLVTGRPPAKGSSVLELIQTKTRIKHLSVERAMPNMKVSGPLSRIIERMTALEPDDRYPDYDELIEDLARAERGITPTPAPKRTARSETTQRVQRPTGPIKKSRAGLMIAAAVIAVSGGAGYAFRTEITAMFGKASDPANQTAKFANRNGETNTPANTNGGKTEGTKTGGDKNSAAQATPAGHRTDEDSGSSVAIVPAVIPVIGPGLNPSLTTPGTSPNLTAGSDLDAPAQTDSAGSTTGRSEEEFSREVKDQRTAFLSRGPAEDLLTATRKLFEDIPSTMTEVRADASALLRDLGIAKEVQGSLRSQFEPTQVRLPFDQLATYLRNVVRVTTPTKDAGPELKQWLEAQRASRVDSEALQQMAESKLRDAWQSLQSSSKTLGSQAEIDKARAQTDHIGQSRERLAELLPKHSRAIHDAAPEGALEAIRKTCKDQSLALHLGSELGEFQQQVKRVRTYRDWLSVGDGLRGAAEEFDARVKAWQAESQLDATELSSALAVIDTELSRWTKTQKDLETIGQHLGNRDFAAVDRDLSGMKASGSDLPELAAIAAAKTAIEAAFEQIAGDFDLKATRAQFARAQVALESLASAARPAQQYIAECLTRLDAFEQATQGMALVAGGKIEINGQEEVEVPSFYLDARECNRADFIAFLGASQGQGFAKLAPKVKAAWPSEKSFDRSIDRLEDIRSAKKISDQHPINGVNYYEAVAFANSSGKSLPTLGEWWLAAHGPKSETTHWSWGSKWSTKSKDRNWSGILTRCDDGGLSQHFTPTEIGVHHLAGNVAEWLDAEGNDRGRLVGGSIQDETRSIAKLKKILAGETRETARFHERQEGYGFRCVLRPAAFFTDLKPR